MCVCVTFMDRTIEEARQIGYTVTVMNRRRYLPDLHSKNRQVRESAERVAINSPVQGSAADMIKVAMVRLHRNLAKHKLKSKMIMQVHDELVFECPAQEKREVEALVKSEMEGVWSMKVPVVVHLDWGRNWDEAH